MMLDYQQALLSVVTLDLEAEHILNDRRLLGSTALYQIAMMQA